MLLLLSQKFICCHIARWHCLSMLLLSHSETLISDQVLAKGKWRRSPPPTSLNAIMTFPLFLACKNQCSTRFPRVFPTYLVAKKLSETKFLFLIFCFYRHCCCCYNLQEPRWKKPCWLWRKSISSDSTSLLALFTHKAKILKKGSFLFCTRKLPP